jgi:hypothetical protein
MKNAEKLLAQVSILRPFVSGTQAVIERKELPKPVSLELRPLMHDGDERVELQEPPSTATEYALQLAGDLRSGGLGTHSGVLRFCEKLWRGNSLLKAASYLPHESDFSKIREWILSHSRVIIQDPSGIPFQYFDPGQWNIRLWGSQGKPIELFAKYPQPQLEAALAAQPRPSLPFGFGYQHLPSNAVMILAERGRSAPAPEVPQGGLRR